MITVYPNYKLALTFSITIMIVIVIITSVYGQDITGTVTDIDGNVYKTVKIGDQWWMAENLKVTHYTNSDVIPNVTDNSTWINLKTGAYCNYDNNEANVATYGRLYNWYAVNDDRIIAPAGWHVPTSAEWQTLLDYLGISCGGKLKEAGTTHWDSPNTAATNESGFTCLPGGYRAYSYGYFTSMGSYGGFWSSTECGGNCALYWDLRSNHSGVLRHNYGKGYGLSVRCVRIEAVENAKPVSSFTVWPSSGTTSTDFQFNASGCSDSEDPVSALQVRWDWEDDGVWDTNFTFNKKITYKYPITGNYTIKLEVRDNDGLTNTTTTQVTIYETGECIDINGNIYKTIKIGNQWWMAENLKVTHYRNGDAIPNVTDADAWSRLNTGAYCNYNNNMGNERMYGRLYNWFAVNDSRNIAPVGWHVPTDAEWQTLFDYLGGFSIAGGKMKEEGTFTWQSPNSGATNQSGFTAKPGGYRDSHNGRFSIAGWMSYFWSSSEYNSFDAFYFYLHYDSIATSRGAGNKQFGYSVRCIKD